MPSGVSSSMAEPTPRAPRRIRVDDQAVSVRITLLQQHAIFDSVEDSTEQRIWYSDIPDLSQFSSSLQVLVVLMVVVGHSGQFSTAEARGLVHSCVVGIRLAFDEALVKDDLDGIAFMSQSRITRASAIIDHPLSGHEIHVTDVSGRT